ncbi:NUDIX domain-containing protein [Trebonia kvetii]|uniref:NUDIX domain-containing protein n=1 Tax=Trebonia kvetii TaxID=2480626 RepID=A0A6P2C2T3_9ACTN|nr:NUDIX domain-containing protein [Trebonia kvetii]
MRWTVHSERPQCEDEWIDIRLADVELPDGRHLEHRLIRTPPGAGRVTVKDGRVLLLWRHRFITGTWGWEIPVGKIDPGEDPAHAAARGEISTSTTLAALLYALTCQPPAVPFGA